MAHGLPFFIKFVNMSPEFYWTFFLLSLVNFLVLYVGIFLPMKSPFARILRPYVATKADHPLSVYAAHNLDAYGPPIVLSQSSSDQPPGIIRYGNHVVFAMENSKK